MHYYRFDINAWSADTGYLLPEEVGVYLRLVNYYYDKEQPIPLEYRAVLKKLSLLSYPNEVETILTDFFIKTENGYKHTRIEEELGRIYEKSDKARKSAEKRWENNANALKNDANAMRTHSERNANAPQTQCDDDPDAMLPSNLLPSNPVPSNPSPKARTKGARAKKPTVFVPPDVSEVSEYFKTKKLNGDAQHFCDHFENCDWKLSNGRGTKMKDWKLAANNWSRNQKVFDPKGTLHLDDPKPKKLQMPNSNNETALIQFARMKGFGEPNAGEDWAAYRGRIQAKVEKWNQERGLL